MSYQRSLAIEQRLEAVLRFIRTRQYSTPRLADEIGVSIPTISRCVEALRDRGHDIVAENHNGAWRFVLNRKTVCAKPSMAAICRKQSKVMQVGAVKKQVGRS